MRKNAIVSAKVLERKAWPLDDAQRESIISFAKQLLVDDGGFRKSTFLSDSAGEIRPPVITRYIGRFPEGWGYLAKIQVDNPTLTPAELIEQFCTPLPQDSTYLVFERNRFIARTLETLQAAIAADTPLEHKDQAISLLENITIPQLSHHPLTWFPDDEFVGKPVNDPLVRGVIKPRTLEERKQLGYTGALAQKSGDTPSGQSR